jgi:hypothetical protein
LAKNAWRTCLYLLIDFCFRFEHKPCKREAVSMNDPYQFFPLERALYRPACNIPEACRLLVIKATITVAKAQRLAVDSSVEDSC